MPTWVLVTLEHGDQMTDQSFKNKTWKTLLKGFKMWAKTVCGEIFGSLNEVTWTVNGPDDPFVCFFVALPELVSRRRWGEKLESERYTGITSPAEGISCSHSFSSGASSVRRQMKGNNFNNI